MHRHRLIAARGRTRLYRPTIRDDDLRSPLEGARHLRDVGIRRDGAVSKSRGCHRLAVGEDRAAALDAAGARRPQEKDDVTRAVGVNGRLVGKGGGAHNPDGRLRGRPDYVVRRSRDRCRAAGRRHPENPRTPDSHCANPPS